MNTQDMSFGEALDWMFANQGKVVRSVSEPHCLSRVRGWKLQYSCCGVDSFFDDANLVWKFKHRWQVVEEKSPLEEAIDNEVPADHTVNTAYMRFAMRRVVNIALEEAKKAMPPTLCDKVGSHFIKSEGMVAYDSAIRDAEIAIDKLKVKE